MEIKTPYVLFLGDAKDHLAIKTAQGVMDWRPDWCIGQIRLPGCNADAGLADMTPAEAAAAGAKTLVIGVVNPGGVLPDAWIDTLVAALDAGLDIASGMHRPLDAFEPIAEAAQRNGGGLHDVRLAKMHFSTATGQKRPGLRLLTVGTDCSIGKKYTALAMEREMRARGFDADFRATGQTGVLISGRGVAIDAVVADFISGAAEWLTPDNAADHWDVVEGQGSLYHPSFAGVSLGLLHGSQPDAFIVCHEPTRTTMRNVDTPMPTIRDVIDLTVRCGRVTNPAIRCIGIAVNTMALDEDAAQAELNRIATAHDLPATDPVRFGIGAIVDALAESYGAP